MAFAGRRYHIITYGCQMNEHDSETMAGLLEEMGMQPTVEEGDADVILLNSCSVRDHAVERMLGKATELKRLKYMNPDVLIGIGGCFPQQDGAIEQIKRRAPHIDLVFGTHTLHALPEILEQTLEHKEMLVEVTDDDAIRPEGLPVRRLDGLKAYVTIIYGCDKACTYCIVPTTRGRERSRQMADVLAEVRRLAEQGVREIMLLGQNVNAYGRDLGGGTSFAELLRRLDEIEGIARIRFMTPHPRDFDDEAIAVMAESKKVCEQVHLPVQSGANSVLRRMLRLYSREQYLDLVERIRRAMPGAALSTDIIVGFPGETEAEFEETLDLVRQVRYDSAYTFMFSPRQGTPATRMRGHLPEHVKKARLERLNCVQAEISRQINESYVGRRVEVLCEGPSKTNIRMLTGRTRTGKVVLFPGPPTLVGGLVDVEIEKAHSWTLHGRLAGSEALL